MLTQKFVVTALLVIMTVLYIITEFVACERLESYNRCVADARFYHADVNDPPDALAARCEGRY